MLAGVDRRGSGMSFYLDRLEAARRQHRMLAEGAAAGCSPPPPRAWPYFHYHHQYYQHAAALLPRSPTLPVPPRHDGEGGVGHERGGGREARDTWPGGSVPRWEARSAVTAGAGAAWGGGSTVSAGGTGGWDGDCVRGVAGSGAPAPAPAKEGLGGVGGHEDREVRSKRCLVAPVSAGVGAAWAGGNAVSAGGTGGLAGDCVRGVAGSPVAPAREEAGGVGGGEEMRNKKCLLAPTPDASCPPPKRRAVPARRRFPPGCGRDAAAAQLVGPDGVDSRSEPARGSDGDSGALQESAIPPAPTTPLAAPSAPCSSQLLNKASAAADVAAGATTDGAHHCPGAALEKPSESPGKNSAAAAAAFCNDTASAQGGVVGSEPAGSCDQLLKSKDNSVPTMRLLPKPTMISAYRRFPPGCQRREAPLLAGGTSSQVRSPSSSEVVPEEQDDDMEIVAPICSGTEDGAAKSEGLVEEQVASEVQESLRPSATLHDEDTTSRHGIPSSSEEIIGNTTWPSEENKSGGSGNSCNVAAESLAQGLPTEHLHGERVVSECATADTASSGGVAVAAGVSDVVGDTTRKKKVMLTPRKSVKPPKTIQNPAALNNTHQCRLPFSKETEEETELGLHTLDETTKHPGAQDPMSVDKCPSWTKGKEAATVGSNFGPKKKKKKANDKEDSNLLDDDILKAIVHEGKFENGPQNADARSRVKMLCSRFESICRAIVQSAEQRSLKVRRIDLAADKLMRKLPEFTKLGPVIGAVPGVEIGDEFLYRVQLALVGLHRPYQGGIDTTRDDDRGGALIAISVVASGGYPDELSCPGELIYTGSGKDGCDQKLEHGNLALRNCVERKVPVRVIHGFKGLNKEGGSHSRAKEITTFVYDGLYRVADCWREGRPGSKVFKYKLQRIPGQPELPLHTAKFARKKNV